MAALLGHGPVRRLLPITEALFTLGVPSASTSLLTHTEPACSLERLLYYNICNYQSCPEHLLSARCS